MIAPPIAGMRYFNPPTPCGVGLPSPAFRVGAIQISIHPPRVGWDPHAPLSRGSSAHFNPPTPCGVGRSTMPAAGWWPNFNPPTPCGVGPGRGRRGGDAQNFNPPTPCGVGRGCNQYNNTHFPFQSTHPVWGGTGHRLAHAVGREISIHPPRVGWDGAEHRPAPGGADFNPPTPCGVGPTCWPPCVPCGPFQSTHPVWGGTSLQDSKQIAPCISIHPPRVGWDRWESIPPPYFHLFQSTHPVWGGTSSKTKSGERLDISIHPPRVGWDSSLANFLSDSFYFNPPTPCGVGPVPAMPVVVAVAISIHPPRVGWDHCSRYPCYRGVYFNPPTPCGVGPVNRGRSF